MVIWGSIGLLFYVSTIIFKFFTSVYLGPRLLIFFYPIIFIALAYVIFKIKENKRKFLAILLVGFFFVNISSATFIPGNIVGIYSLPDSYQEYPQLAAIDWFKGGNALGPSNFVPNFWYYKEKEKGNYMSEIPYNATPQNLTPFKSISLVYLEKSNPNTNKLMNSLNVMSSVKGVYDNGFWKIFYIR